MTIARAAALAAAVLAGRALAGEPPATPVGEWLTDGKDARVRIGPCADRPDRLCGLITRAERPPDAPPGPLVDRNNGDPALRSRPIEGLPLLDGFAPDGEGGWGGGTIYDPRSGRTYRSTMRLRPDGGLEVSGCVLFVCRGEVWTRHGP